jgi:hypothetical protein
MTIQQLIETLEEIKEHVSEDAEVRFASQPSWPFEYSIADAYFLNMDARLDLAHQNHGDYFKDIDEIKKEKDVVYLEEGSQIGYLPGEAKELIGW